MSQTIIKRTALAAAISIAVTSQYAIAIPDQLPITNMQFGTDIYTAGGFFNSTGTVDSFDPATNLVTDPATKIRSLASGFDPLTASGNIYSFDPFFGNPWEGTQKSVYLTNKDSWAFVFDDVNSDCTAPTGVIPGKDTGPCSGQGSYDYDDVLGAMTDEQTAIGMFFNWSVNQGIAVMDVFNCDANDNCTGTGIPVANGPFAGSEPVFNAGLSCAEGFTSTAKDTAFSLDIAKDVLGIDAPPSNCNNPTDTTNPANPAGLKVDSVVSPTANGGTAIINGTNIDYTPPGGFEGADSFVINISDDTGLSSATTYLVQVGGQLQNNFSMLDKSGAVFGGSNDVDIVWDETTFNAMTTTNVVDSDGIGRTIPNDTSNYNIMTIASPEPFFNFNWTAHNVRIFKNDEAAAVTFSFDVTCTVADYEANIVDCSANPLGDQGAIERYMTMTLEPGEIGGHILFDWGKNNPGTACGQQNCDIDVVNKWSAGQWNKYGQTAPINTVWIGPAGVPPATVENSGEGDQANWVLVSGDVNGDGINASPMIDGGFVGSYASFNYKPDKPGTPLPPHTGKIEDVEVTGFSTSLWTLFAGLFSVMGLRRFAGSQVRR